jgi:hypothetical protein
MLGSVVNFVKFALLCGAALLILLAALSFTLNAFARAFSSGSVQIGKFADPGDANKNRAGYVLARAQVLAQPVRLDGLYEVKVPPLTTRFGLKEDLKFLDDVKVNIQGVNIPETIKSLFSVLPDDQTVVSAEPEAVSGGGSALRVEWKEPWGEKRQWLVQSAFAATNQEAAKEIIDKAIYEMVYYMHYDPKGPAAPRGGSKFPNARALEAYYSGQEHLSVYQRQRPLTEADEAEKQARERQLKELAEAEKQFRILYQEMPNFVDGLMLLGVTLLERNSEAEARVIFGRAKSILQEKQTRSPDEEKARLSAMLLNATALRKSYDWHTTHLALRELAEVEKLKAEVDREPAADARPEDVAKWQDHYKIYLSALVEKAYAFGTYLVLLNERNFLEAVKQEPLASLGRTDEQKKALTDIEAALKDATKDQAQVRKDRGEIFKKEIDTIYAAHTRAAADAENLIKKYRHRYADDAWAKALDRFLSDLRNAEGYAIYRHAYIAESDDEKFNKRCDLALDKLNEGHAVRQVEQSILLNIGLIAGDARYDVKGENFRRARRFLTDAAMFKPNDYYAHQLLSNLAIRQYYALGPEFTEASVITEAVNEAKRARELRPGGPGSGTIYVLLAQAATLQWTVETAAAKREEIRALIEASLLQGERRGANAVHFQIAKVQWLLQQVRASAGDDVPADLMGKLKAQLDAAIAAAGESLTWAGRQLARDATALKAAVSNLKPKEHTLLRWPG